MLRRGSSRGAFPSALVFPGGVLEAEDYELAAQCGSSPGDEDAALRVAAIRETWEEVGVLLAKDRAGRQLSATAVPTPAEAGQAGLRGVLNAATARLTVSEIAHFGRWITPVGGRRRFDTEFYIAVAPEGQEPTADGVEAVSVRWVRPAEVPGLTTETLLLPTLMNLKRLGGFETASDALAAAARFPQVAVTPTVGFAANGDPVVRIPASAGYGVTEFWPQDPGHFRMES